MQTQDSVRKVLHIIEQILKKKKKGKSYSTQFECFWLDWLGFS